MFLKWAQEQRLHPACHTPFSLLPLTIFPPLIMSRLGQAEDIGLRQLVCIGTINPSNWDPDYLFQVAKNHFPLSRGRFNWLIYCNSASAQKISLNPRGKMPAGRETKKMGWRYIWLFFLHFIFLAVSFWIFYFWVRACQQQPGQWWHQQQWKWRTSTMKNK